MSIFDKLFKGNQAGKQEPIDMELINAIIHDNAGQAVQSLRSGANPNAFDKNLLPALLLSASRKQVEVVEALIQHGADVNRKGTDASQGIFNGAPLMMASANGNVDIVKLLLDAHADTNISDDSGLTPLMSAAYMGHDDIL